MNILVDPDSGHLTGVVHWADASIEPFGIALWGLGAYLVAAARKDGHTTEMMFRIHGDCLAWCY